MVVILFVKHNLSLIIDREFYFFISSYIRVKFHKDKVYPTGKF